jgi:hypothetical protein
MLPSSSAKSFHLSAISEMAKTCVRKMPNHKKFSLYYDEKEAEDQGKLTAPLIGKLSN